MEHDHTNLCLQFLFTLLHTPTAPNLTVIIEGADVTTGSTHTLTCSVSGVNLAAVTSLSYTWFYNGVEKQSMSASNQFSTGIVQLSNAGDEYSCQVKVKASYWDASGSFRGTGSGVLSVTSNYNNTPLIG